MTEQELRENLSTTYDIYSFCWDNGFEEFCEDWITDLDSYIEEELREFDMCDYLRHNSWWELRDALYNIDTGYSVYRINGYFDYEEIDSDFNYLLDDLINMLRDADFFEEDNDEEEFNIEYPDDEEEEFVNPINDLIAVGFYEGGEPA